MSPNDFFPTLSVDAKMLSLDPQPVQLAPTKETLSFRTYTARRRLNKLRRSACILYQSEASIKLIRKLEREVELERILVRPDRKLHADLGIKQTILDMILCYNPLWLRIGLEVAGFLLDFNIKLRSNFK